MTDTIIANLPSDALRSVLRSLLGTDEKVTPAFHALAAAYLDTQRPTTVPRLLLGGDGKTQVTPAFQDFQSRYRCLMGCGRGFESLDALCEVLEQAAASVWPSGDVAATLAVVDSDLVQAMTAMQKELRTATGNRELVEAESNIVEKLISNLARCEQHALDAGVEFPFQRAMSSSENLFGSFKSSSDRSQSSSLRYRSKESKLETTLLGSATVPQIFMGLWQFSSPAWGTASRSQIEKSFRRHIDMGFTAYGMNSPLLFRTLGLY